MWHRGSDIKSGGSPTNLSVSRVDDRESATGARARRAVCSRRLRGSSIHLVSATVAIAVASVCVGLAAAARAEVGAAKPSLTIGFYLPCGSQTPLGGGPLRQWDFAYESLIHKKPDGSYAPELATSW